MMAFLGLVVILFVDFLVVVLLVVVLLVLVLVFIGCGCGCGFIGIGCVGCVIITGCVFGCVLVCCCWFCFWFAYIACNNGVIKSIYESVRGYVGCLSFIP